MSPAFAKSIALRVSASCSPSSNASIASVALFQESLGQGFKGTPARLRQHHGASRWFASKIILSDLENIVGKLKEIYDQEGRAPRWARAVSQFHPGGGKPVGFWFSLLWVCCHHRSP
jgi:hypothetical protein